MDDTIGFNRIYVIQSLPDHETQTGTALINDIISRRQLGFNYLTSELVEVSKREDLGQELLRIAELFYSDGVVPYLHFEMHGSLKGLHLKSGEMITWSELRPLLSKINARINNNLFVSLATCHGAFMVNAIDPLDRIPFYAFIGPIDEVKERVIEADWVRYFDCLLLTRDFAGAIEQLNTNDGMRYMFFTGEAIFDKVMSYFENAHKGEGLKEERAYSLMRDALDMPGMTEKYSVEQLNIFVENYLSNYLEIVRRMKDYFLFKTDDHFLFPDIFTKRY